MALQTDAIFIPTNEKFDLPRSSSQLLNSNIAERIRQQFHAAFPFGIAVGQVVPLKAEDLVWDVVYVANIGAANSGKEINRKVSVKQFTKEKVLFKPYHMQVKKSIYI